MIRLSSLRSRPRPSWTWWLLMCCGLCPCYRSSVLYGSVDSANATSSAYDSNVIQLEQMTDDDEDFFEVGLGEPNDVEDDTRATTTLPPSSSQLPPNDPLPPTADVVRALIEAIGRREEVAGKVSSTSINLPLLPLGSRGLAMLSQALFTHPTLLTLELIGNEIGGSASFVELSQLLTLTRSLSSLTLSHNELSDNSVRQLSVGLRENQSLRSLNLSNNGLTDGGMQSLCAALSDNRGLERLDVSGNLSIGDLTVDALLESERKRRRRRKREEKERERHHNNTTSSPAPIPTPSTSSQRNLTHLILASNSLSPHCVPSLLELLSLSSLIHLDCSHCLLDDAACEMLVEEAVERSKQLKGLRVEGNEVGEKTRRKVEGWRRWVKGLDDVEEKKREEGREIVVEEVKVEKKPKTNGTKSRPRSERNSGKLEGTNKEQKEMEERLQEKERDRRKEEKPLVKLEALDGDALLEQGEGENVEVVVVPGDVRNGGEGAVVSGLPRLVDAAPAEAFTIDEEAASGEEDEEAAAVNIAANTS